MIILGIGSNLGRPLDNLREAIRRLKQLSPLLILKSVSPVYHSQAQLSENAPKDWQKSYLNIAVRCCAQDSLTPENLLNNIKKIEKNMGRISSQKWAPRIIDIDILIWENLIYHKNNIIIPHPEILKRPFALLPLLDICPEWRHPKADINNIIWLKKGFRQNRQKISLPFHTQVIKQTLNKPLLMGIVNLTPDSFSDGNQFLNPDDALKQISRLIRDGAEIIDIGAESTRPGAVSLTSDQECERLLPVLKKLKILLDNKPLLFKPLISIDTYHAKTADKLLQKSSENLIPINIINDVSGKEIREIAGLLKNTDTAYIAMHNLGVPASSAHVLPVKTDLVQTVYQWGEKQIEKLMQFGLKQTQIIFDPGIGFGKTSLQSWELIKRISAFKTLGVKILAGHSRKSFLNVIFNFNSNINIKSGSYSAKDFYTAMISYHLAQKNIDYLRIHHIKKTYQALETYHCLFTDKTVL